MLISPEFRLWRDNDRLTLGFSCLYMHGLLFWIEKGGFHPAEHCDKILFSPLTEDLGWNAFHKTVQTN